MAIRIFAHHISSCRVKYGHVLSIVLRIPWSMRRTLLNAANISLDEGITQNVSRRWWGTHLSIASRRSEIGCVLAATAVSKNRGNSSTTKKSKGSGNPN